MTQSGLDCSAVVVELHPADAKTSLAFLKAYLPHSLPVCASILCGPIESPLNGDDSFTEPWAYAWTTLTPGDLERRSSNTGWDNSEYPDYVFIVQLAGSMRHQTRIFCSAECPRPDESAEDQLDRRKRGSHLVRGAVERYLRITKTVTVLGAVHQYWLAELYEALGMEYTERLTDLWLEPTRETGQGQGGQVDRIRGYEEGYQYSVDEANGEDCQLVRDNRGIKEAIAYYLERRQHTTVIRHGTRAGGDSRAVAWVMTHAAGDQGALHVEPDNRRRGLAKWVVLANLEREREAGRDVQGHVWVQRGNEASEALWRAMGWEKAWTVQWIHLGRNGY